MASNKRDLLSAKTALLAAASVGVFYVIVRNRSRIRKSFLYALDFRNPLRHREIKVIETVEECQDVVSMLKSHCRVSKVLGFDCEWVTVGGTRRPTALLQLSSHQGLCGLFRLCCLRQIPKSLRELLEDDDIIKVGVGPQDDAQKLAHDYGVGVASTFDLRFLASMTGHKSEGLAKLSKNILGVHLDKNWRLVCSDWESKELTEKQLHYAANDALVAVEIFYKLSKEMEPKNVFHIFKTDFETIWPRLEPFLEVRFKESFAINLATKNVIATENFGKKCGRDGMAKKNQSRGICTRSKVQYDNCLLEAPDGELLCTIDRNKAQWYLEQNLGLCVKDDPFTVRLNFEPAGRAVGEVGRYYQTPKENQCVACGWRDAYIRKNVVPREYRKHFPVVMKSHTSHDVLLLCPRCHQLSNISDLKVRTKLAQLCDAPLTNEDGARKCFEVSGLRQLKSAARALLQNEEKIPAKRKEDLREIILNHFPNANELTPDILQEAANINTTLENENYCQHGQKVVQKFQTELGGLIELEKLWREHFLQTMKPKFLPTLWNVNHNANRLEIRAHDGRIEKSDLIIAGLNSLACTEEPSQNKKDDSN